MKKIVIEGGTKLRGSIDISGSKNSSLPILAATLLIDEKITLTNVKISRSARLEFNKIGCFRSF